MTSSPSEPPPSPQAFGDERARLLDAGRPDAVERQHRRGALTARERIARLLDATSFVEYGLLARPAHPDLDGPADGIVTGVGTLRGRPLAVVSYDYTVLGASQGHVSHLKIDRILALAASRAWPVAIFSEGGGARAQELGIGFGTSARTFVSLARLSGQVPVVCAVVGPAFAGHANLAGLCDLVVATRRATMGMAGPPLVESATGERLSPEQIGPVEVHARAGAVDLLVEDDARAVDALRTYLAFFEGRGHPVDPPVPRDALRTLVPGAARQAYDVRKVITALADADSAMELRAEFARNVVTALARIDGRPVGLVASQPMVMAGAIDANASDKIARFVQLCDAFGLPLVFLVDTPGFMVGPQVETTALVRHSARVIHALARASAPILTVVLRKAYGLGYYAMGSPPFDPVLAVAWPGAEFGGMGLEGAVNILHRDEIEATGAPRDVRRAHTERLRQDHTARALAGRFRLDDVIDPADTRDILARALAVAPAARTPRADRRGIDPW
ncbi:MAG: biotin carboxylase [Candidatus Rokubacteria bacterium]|nr:biotin carboxylase [Candidatus Rokubacteria bacterium]